MIEKVFLKCLSNCNLFCYDLSDTLLASVDKRVTKCLVALDCDYKTFNDNFEKDDWIIFAVPLNHLESSIKLINNVCKDGSLFITLTSTQVDAIRTLKDNVPTACSYLGCHPLFGPSLSSPIAQMAALVDFKEDNKAHHDFKKCLATTGLLIGEISSSEHDESMAIVQALTHFTYLSFAHTIGRNGYKPKSLLNTTTPNFQFLYAFTSRILGLASTTTGAIQSTPEAKKIRNSFIESATILNKEFHKCSSLEDAAQIIDGLKKPFKGEDVKEGVEIAAIAVDSIQRIEELFYRYKRLARPFIFRHKTTKRLHIVIIKEIHRDAIVYIESTKRIDIDSRRYYAIGLDKQSKEAYRKQGVNFEKSRKVKIKKQNIELLQAGELNDFHKNDILPAFLTFSLENPFNYDESYFESWLPLLVDGLWSVEFKESYRRKNEVERVSLDISFSPEVSRNRIITRIENVIKYRLIDDVEKNKALQQNIAKLRKNT